MSKSVSRQPAEVPRRADSNPLREARESLEQAEALRRERKLDKAESICTGLVRRYPDYFGAQHTLGLIYADRGDYPRAAGCLARAAMLNPRSWLTHTALAGVYLQLDANEMAAHTLELARAIKPNEPSVLVTLGEIYSEEREYELARDAYRQALEAEPGMEEASIGLARACTSLGELGEAADALDELLKRGVRTLGVFSGLILLPASLIKRDIMPELDRVARRADEERDDFERGMAFVRAAALDKVGRHAEAWEQAVKANRVMAATMKKDLAENITRREKSLRWLRENSLSVAKQDQSQPISLFILGPSRSGKTTVESLASLLDGVKRGYENPSVENAIGRTYQDAGLLTTYTLDYLPPQFFPQFRDLYAEELARRAPSARVFTNTHPGHIHEVGRMAQTLPNARFIFVKRNPEDVVLRIFQRLYRRGNPYSYDVRTAHEHVDWYNQMMDAMAEKLPEIVRVVQYEDMVSDPKTVLRTVADLCGLPLEHKPIPALGNDQGCAEPYRELMTAALGH